MAGTSRCTANSGSEVSELAPCGNIAGVTSRTLRLVPVLALLGSPACDKSKEAPPPASATAPTPSAEAKAPPGPPPTAHGSPHDAAAPDPHATQNPHGAMGDPHGGAPAAAAGGPPRDIQPSGETVTQTIGGLTFDAPKEWEKAQASSPMRLGQFVLPGPGGDAELVLFRFPGGAGGVDANIERWKGQFTPPEGKTIQDVSKTENLTVGDLKITVLDVTGRAQGSMGQAAPQGTEHRMLAAIVEGKGDPVFLKAMGPQKTLDLWATPFQQTLQTVKVE